MEWNKLSSITVAPGQKLRLSLRPGKCIWCNPATRSTTQLSRRYQGVTVEQLKQLNHLTSDEVKPGQLPDKLPTYFTTEPWAETFS